MCGYYCFRMFNWLLLHAPFVLKSLLECLDLQTLSGKLMKCSCCNDDSFLEYHSCLIQALNVFGNGRYLNAEGVKFISSFYFVNLCV